LGREREVLIIRYEIHSTQNWPEDMNLAECLLNGIHHFTELNHKNPNLLVFARPFYEQFVKEMTLKLSWQRDLSGNSEFMGFPIEVQDSPRQHMYFEVREKNDRRPYSWID